MNERPGDAVVAEEDFSVEELLGTLRDSEILAALQIKNEDLLLVRTDSDLLETLRITRDFLLVLKSAGVLATFLRMPRSDQADFVRWIATTDDQQLRLTHTETFVAALKSSPLFEASEL